MPSKFIEVNPVSGGKVLLNTDHIVGVFSSKPEDPTININTISSTVVVKMTFDAFKKQLYGPELNPFDTTTNI